MQTNNSLPFGFEKLKSIKPYINIIKLPEGEHRFRIVERPIAGWIDWKDNKPLRFRPDSKPANSVDAEKPMRPFWALHVWDYQQNGLFIMEVTQSSIRKALENYALSEDWGDLTGYDIKIKKTGSNKETKYEIIPIPPKPVSKEIKDATSSMRIRLEALYEGKDPWTDLDEGAVVNKRTGEVVESPPAKLTEKQVTNIVFLLEEIDDVREEKKIKSMFGITELDDIPVLEYNRVVASLEQKLKGKGKAHGSSAA